MSSLPTTRLATSSQGMPKLWNRSDGHDRVMSVLAFHRDRSHSSPMRGCAQKSRGKNESIQQASPVRALHVLCTHPRLARSRGLALLRCEWPRRTLGTGLRCDGRVYGRMVLLDLHRPQCFFPSFWITRAKCPHCGTAFSREIGIPVPGHIEFESSVPDFCTGCGCRFRPKS